MFTCYGGSSIVAQVSIYKECSEGRHEALLKKQHNENGRVPAAWHVKINATACKEEVPRGAPPR